MKASMLTTRILQLILYMPVISIASAIPSYPQEPAEPQVAMLVTWHGTGGITLPTSPAWKLNFITAYDIAGRPVASFKNETTHVIASFIIFENQSGYPTAGGCRSDVIAGILKKEKSLISNRVEGEIDDGRGGKFATMSHLAELSDSTHNHDLFAFAGNAKTCAEIHVSTVAGRPDEEKRLSDALGEFHPNLSYNPIWLDYFSLASKLYQQSPMLAAPYFDSALKGMPDDPKFITLRRLATDVVTVALGRIGDLKGKRAYALRAIKTDPDYPLNYYHLACADAEERKPAEAKLHLQQAFDRKANVVPG